MRFIYIFIAIFILSGCTTKVPSVSEYRISTKINPLNLTQQSCKDSSLKIAQAFSSNVLMSTDMSYAQGEYKQDSFSQSEWAESPNKAITNQIVKYIQSSKLFKSTQIAKSRTKSEMVLETNIEDFMQYFSPDEKTSYANVVITFTLLDSKNSIISSKRFTSKVDVKTLDAEGGVEALNKALENVLFDMGNWLGESCQ
jgi:cholesterol transport system auxiliary component